MLGLVLFIMFLYSLVAGSILYFFVGFLHKSTGGGWKKIGKWFVCIIFSYIIIYTLQSNGVPIIR
jgi:hypothetical protein